MAIVYEPGDEIQITIGRTIYFAPALSWRDQKKSLAITEAIKAMDDAEEQVDAGLAHIAERVTRSEPETEITADELAGRLDEKSVWALLVALQHNLADEEKKSCS